jgi:hypothetical protein
MRPTPNLKVLPNPFYALDADGMPSCHVREDPFAGRKGVVTFIGVQVLKEVLTGDAAPEGNAQREPHLQRRSTRFVWAQAPVEIAPTEYHRDQVRAGAILAADKATAQACRIWFVEPAAAIAQTKKREIAAWVASHGEDPPVDEWDAAVGPQKPVEAAPVVAEKPVLASPFGGAPQKEVS